MLEKIDNACHDFNITQCVYKDDRYIDRQIDR
jgi:hypothetical protein